VRIVFMGSSDFGIPCLEELIRSGHSIAGIVSTPARKKGRGLVLSDSSITEYAVKKGIGPVLTPESLSSASVTEELKKISSDVFVVVAFRILPKAIFEIPALGTYNVHASILPKYRGPAPIHRAILAGDTETGVTVFRIDQGVDTGAVIVTKKTAIGPEETTPQLSKRLSQLGAGALVEALELVQNGTAVYGIQDNILASPAPKLLKAEGQIRWDTSAVRVFNMIRAFKPFPGAYTFLDNTRITIEWGIPVFNDAGTFGPGIVSAVCSDGFEVQCGCGRLKVLMVKPEGKKIMQARDFVNGRGVREGTKFS
jgi:methionyl-tRNA formyltransferase